MFTHRKLLAGLACLTCLSALGADYCLRPGRGDGTQADSVVCCTTPSGWRGWKDDADYRARIKRLDAYSTMWLRRLVSFHQPNCEKGPECPYLALDARGRDPRGKPDIEAGLRDFINQLEQPQDLSPRHPSCVIVSRFGSFHTENSGEVTIWRIRCPSGSQRFVTLLAQRDVLVTIDLGGPNIKDIVPKLDSLKELARSVRIIDASLAVPDIIEIDAARLSGEAIRQQLLQLTPVGTSMEKVHEVLEWRLRLKGNQPVRTPGNLHWAKGDPYTEMAATLTQALLRQS
jgi:hypothetical protein